MNISVCFTTYNRTGLLFKAVEPFIESQLVDEIVISDDHSQPEIFGQLIEKYEKISKVKIYQNESNVDCYHNKARAVARAINPWVCLLDSDNEFGKDFIDRIENLVVAGVNESTIYTPSFAKPHFDFTGVAGVNICRANIAGLIHSDKVQTMLNAANYFVFRDRYLDIFNLDIDPVTSDSIYMASRWIESGGSIYVVPDLSYYHRVNNHGNEEPSHYGKNVRRTPANFHLDIIEKLKRMT